MAQTLVIPSNDTPSLLNKTALIGVLIGASLTGGIGLAAIGGIVGSLIDYGQQVKEKDEGKIVKSPSFWNKDTTIGGLIGNLTGGYIGAWVGGGLLLAAAAASGVDFSNIFSLINSGAPAEVVAPVAEAAIQAIIDTAPGTLLAAAVATIGTWMGGTALGTYLGGKIGKNRMEREYAEAEQYVAMQQQPELSKAPSIAQAQEQSVTPEKSWAKEVDTRRSMAAAQQNARA